MKLGRNNVKGLKVKILFGIIGIIVILLLILCVFKWNSYKKDTIISDDSSGDTIISDDSCGSKDYYNNNYIYKIRYDLGAEDYIYLLPNNVIKKLEIQEVSRIVPDCNCMEFTGEYKYYEETIDFSEKSKETAINVFNELSKKSGKNCFNADDMKLTKYQEKILLAIILNSEDEMTLEDN